MLLITNPEGRTHRNVLLELFDNVDIPVRQCFEFVFGSCDTSTTSNR